MKVRELVELLQSVDPERTVFMYDREDDHYWDASSVEEVVLHRHLGKTGEESKDKACAGILHQQSEVREKAEIWWVPTRDNTTVEPGVYIK